MKRPRPVMVATKKAAVPGMEQQPKSTTGGNLVPAALAYRKKAAQMKSRGNSYGV